jgi:hypothetical protein
MCPVGSRTGLGKESLETLVGVLSLALLGKVTIGLAENVRYASPGRCLNLRVALPGYRARGSRAILDVSNRERCNSFPKIEKNEAYLPAGVGNLAASLAD